MPKPLAGVQGSGMHTHMSLFEGRRERLLRPRRRSHGLSKVARQFIAGLLHHAPEITAVTNQWVNSYKRLVVGYEAPVHVSWARNNRSALVRVPVVKRGKEALDPHRVPGARSGLQPLPGLLASSSPPACAASRGLRAPPGGGGQPLRAHRRGAPRERASSRSPRRCREALDVMERSELVAETLGEHVFEWFIRNKRAEWADYKSQVTPFELERYLERPLR